MGIAPGVGVGIAPGVSVGIAPGVGVGIAPMWLVWVCIFCCIFVQLKATLHWMNPRVVPLSW